MAKRGLLTTIVCPICKRQSEYRITHVLFPPLSSPAAKPHYRLDHPQPIGYDRGVDKNAPMNPVTTGSLAAEAVEPCQVRKEAALRRLFRVPRTTWSVIGLMGAFCV